MFASEITEQLKVCVFCAHLPEYKFENKSMNMHYSHIHMNTHTALIYGAMKDVSESTYISKSLSSAL